MTIGMAGRPHNKTLVLPRQSKAAHVYHPEKRNFPINIVTAAVTVNTNQSLIMTPSELASSVVVPLARPNLGPARDHRYRTLVLATRSATGGVAADLLEAGTIIATTPGKKPKVARVSASNHCGGERGNIERW